MGNRRLYSNYNRRIHRRNRMVLHSSIYVLGAAVLIAAALLLGVAADWIVYTGLAGGLTIMLFGGWLENRQPRRRVLGSSRYITCCQLEGRDRKVRSIGLMVTIIAIVAATVLIGLVLISKPPLVDAKIGILAIYVLTVVAVLSMATTLVGYRPIRTRSY